MRVTPGVEADTHPAIRTAHEGSKFGLPPEQAIEALSRAKAAGLDTAGLHVHIGSQLLGTKAALETVEWVGGFAARCRDELDWTPEVVDLGGGLGIRYVEREQAPSIESFVGEVTGRLEQVWRERGLPKPQLILEPGRSLVGRAGLTLYEVGTVKQVSDELTYVAVDGGMSDNPRPQLYDAAYSGLLANRADEPPSGTFVVCGKHCESGDVMIHDLPLRRRRGAATCSRFPGPARTRWRWRRTTTRFPDRAPCSSRRARPGSSAGARPSTTFSPGRSDAGAAIEFGSSTRASC